MATESGKFWRLGAGYLLAAAAVIFAARYLGVQGPQFVQAMAAIDPFRLLLAFSLLIVSLALNAVAFAFANRAFAVEVPSPRLSAVWLATLLAKYVPVGIGHVLGRGLMLSRFGVSTRTTVIVGVLEQGFSLAICAVIAVGAATLIHRVDGVAWIGLAVLLGVALLVATAMALRQRLEIKVAPLMLSLFGYAAAMAPYAGAYLLLVEPVETLEFIRALFAGTIAGVLAIVVPGGLGVRETVLASMSDSGHASAILAGAVATRALIVLSECAGTVVGYMILRRTGAWR